MLDGASALSGPGNFGPWQLKRFTQTREMFTDLEPDKLKKLYYCINHLPPPRADPTHVDANNNLGAALTSLETADRTRLAKITGLLELPGKQNRPHEGKRVDADIGAVDKVMEDLFLRALELEPTHRWALVNLGLHLHARSRNDEVRVRNRGTQASFRGN